VNVDNPNQPQSSLTIPANEQTWKPRAAVETPPERDHATEDFLQVVAILLARAHIEGRLANPPSSRAKGDPLKKAADGRMTRDALSCRVAGPYRDLPPP
jgi:hypothetical protein